jgi:hypothetical protein
MLSQMNNQQNVIPNIKPKPILGILLHILTMNQGHTPDQAP